MNEWDERAEYYRDSPTHAAGDDLDQVVEWCEPRSGLAALDVAPRGGHVARRLRERGCVVTSCDAAAGMKPDVVCPAEELPFEDESFDVVACRVALHHLSDAAKAVRAMARVSRRLVVLEDTLWVDERVQEAEAVRDPTHVRHYRRAEVLAMLAAAGLEVVGEATFFKRHQMDDWLGATGCAGEDARRVRELLAHVSEPDGDGWTDAKIVLKAAKTAAAGPAAAAAARQMLRRTPST